MDLKTLKTLEYDKILYRLRNFAVSSCTKEAIDNILPEEGKDNILNALSEVKEAYRAKYDYGADPVEDFADCVEICQKAIRSIMLSPSDLIKVRRLMRSGRIAQSTLQPLDTELLVRIVGTYYVDKGLEDEIERCILSETEIGDNASSTLRDIRRKIAEKKNSLREKLSGYFRKSEYSKFLQDNLVTIRNDRFVLPVKSEYRSSVPGLIHDMSSSGATVFIEPFAVVETNNEIKSLMLSEAAEIERILSDLSLKVANISDNLIKMQSAVVKLDIIFAKMKYSVDYKGTVPVFNDIGKIDLKAARHPLIDFKIVVPVGITVGKDYKILMITGPNTGGKTVCLKTVGLVCLMAYTGLFVPCAEGSEVAIFDRIYCDIGDDQSIAQSLSTFSSHIVNLVRITDDLTKNTLLLLDELGGGTDPKEGASLAIGIIKYIEMWQSTAIITTHYGELKEYALVSPNISNASMQFDSKTLKPTYKLLIGIPGTSNALSIAESLGLNPIILKYALLSMDEEKIRLENLIKSAEDVKRRSEEELENTEKLKSELIIQRSELKKQQDALNDRLEKINFGAKTEIKRLVSIGMEKADELIEELKEKVKKGDERALLEAKALRKRLENIAYENDDEPQKISYEKFDISKAAVGDKVYVKSLNSVGALTSLPDKKGEVGVSLGAINTKIKVSELFKPIIEVASKKKEPRSEYKPAVKKETYALIPEVNVIGFTVSEAIEIVEPYLISTSGDGAKTLRIVHGKGTGALGRGLQQYLKTSPYVKSYRYGGYGEGESGVTIVELN